MAYVKQNWENLPSTNTPITAERLNHMEDGIYEASEQGGGTTIEVINNYSESTDNPYSANYVNSLGSGIVESGTGYIRFGDGTQICYGSANPSAFPNNNVCTGSGTFAKEFATTPTVIASLWGTLSNSSDELTINVKVSGITTSYFSFSEHSSAGAFGTVARRMSVQYIAIGTWQ